MAKKGFFTFLSVSILALLVVSCSNPPNTFSRITFSDLASDPEAYNGQSVVISGYWFDGFEMAVLAERLEPSSFAEGNLQPAGILIWVKGGLSQDISELYLQPDNPTGYPAHYGKIELEGKLEYGGEYGHMNAYQFQLTTDGSELLPWTPSP